MCQVGDDEAFHASLLYIARNHQDDTGPVAASNLVTYCRTDCIARIVPVSDWTRLDSIRRMMALARYNRPGMLGD